MDFLGLIGLLGVFCVLAMAFAWGVQAVTGNASWVDAVYLKPICARALPAYPSWR